jgi:hypothetical protein
MEGEGADTREDHTDDDEQIANPLANVLTRNGW